MERNAAAALIRSLLDRLDDGERGRRQLVGYISANEFEALQFAAGFLEVAAPVPEPAGPEAVDTTSSKGTSASGTEGATPPGSGATTKSAIKLEIVPPDAIDDPDVTLCLDFGTAMSKAFAMRNDDDEPEPLWIAIGDYAADQHTDDSAGPSTHRSKFTLPSSMLIEANGDIYLGIEALDRSAADDTHPRFDSLKEYLSAAEGKADVFNMKVRNLVPEAVQITVGEALLLYLAYLTEMALGACGAQHHTGRNLRRRFALPAWTPDQAKWATDLLRRELARAHLLANALQGGWSGRLNLNELRPLLRAAAEVPADSLPLHLIELGVLEPLAAGASRMEPGAEGRSFLAVVDVGAGTTDFGMFRLQSGTDGKWRAYPIQGTTDALRRAGNALDKILMTLVKEKLAIGSGGADAIAESRMKVLQNHAREWKEQLFEAKVLAVTVVDHPIRITLDEFLAHPEVVKFSAQIEERFKAMLGRVSSDGYTLHAPMGVGLLATGGGASLPMVQALLKLQVSVGSSSLRIAEARGMPEYLLAGVEAREHAALNQAYPQLAVAIGGSSPFYADLGYAIDGNVAPRSVVRETVGYKNDNHE